MTPTRRVTSSDVAREAGVSRATVSYVLNNTPRQSIPESTRQRVLAAAQELNYTPHAAARALRAGESNLVLFINTGVPYGVNLSVLLDTLTAEVSATGRSLVIWQQRDPADLATTLAHLQPRLAIALGELDDTQRALLAQARIPTVETDLGRDPVSPDVGTALQIQHLAGHGHRRLGYLTTSQPELERFTVPRLATARSTALELGLTRPLVYDVGAQLPEVSVDALASVLRDWTGGAEPVTAVACYNDICAAACIAAAPQAGLEIPGDLAVIGMDDETMSAFTRPALTTIRLDMISFAEHLWERTSAALENRPEPGLFSSMSFTLVERASV